MNHHHPRMNLLPTVIGNNAVNPLQGAAVMRPMTLPPGIPVSGFSTGQGGSGQVPLIRLPGGLIPMLTVNQVAGAPMPPLQGHHHHHHPGGPPGGGVGHPAQQNIPLGVSMTPRMPHPPFMQQPPPSDGHPGFIFWFFRLFC